MVEEEETPPAAGTEAEPPAPASNAEAPPAAGNAEAEPPAATSAEVTDGGPSPDVIAALLQSVYSVAAEAAVARATAADEAAAPAEAPPAEEPSPTAVTGQPSFEATTSHEEPSPTAVTGQPSFEATTSHEEPSPTAVTGQPSFEMATSHEEPSPTAVTGQPSFEMGTSHEEASPTVAGQPSFQTTASFEEPSPTEASQADSEERTPAPVTAQPSFAVSASIVEEDSGRMESPKSYQADWLTAETSRETRETDPSTEESELERTLYRSPEVEEKKKPKEIAWTHLSVASEDVLDSLETAVQYTSMARTLREKGLLGRGIRMMERALAIVERRELSHPALCLEAAKVRLNYAAYLSEGFRHRLALQIIKDAQETLTKLLQWAVQCPPEDLAVQALGREARALHTAAIVAQAMAVEYCNEDDDDGFDAPEGPDEAAKESARISAAGLSPDHPLAKLVRQNLGVPPRPTGGRRQSNLGTAVRRRVSNVPLQPMLPHAGTSSTGILREGELTTDVLQEAPPQERAVSRGSRHRGSGSDFSASKARPVGKEERMDVFKQYLRDREMARVAHLLALSDDWETQTRKKLFEVHKQTKFQLELVNTEELKEKRYTRVGHKVFMQNLKSSNKCWSNPDISREARKDRTAPEITQLKKLSKKIYVKPPPAPPPPPPPKPKVDASLAGNMKMSMRRGSAEDA